MIQFPASPGDWVELKDRCVFRLTGPDRVRYLNGQVTNDVSADLSNRTVSACVCSVKGKVEALVRVTAEEDALIVDGELSQRDFLLERLDRYLIADDCEWVDITGQRKLVHCLESRPGGRTSNRFLLPGSDIWLAADEQPSLDETGSMSPTQLQQIEILSMVPRSGWEITGEEFPAELGLDRTAVDFHKGCYLGQEVISRIQSVGRVKRSLVLIAAENEIARDSIVRNDKEQLGIATRPAVCFGEKKWVGLALFGGKLDSSQPTENAHVTELSQSDVAY